mmetsp:Transcript_99053/g.206472  ORF Transcript_99053/g.206472 Transcript_99053/m.206472 type:complete len:898 (-) Transcript_99053:20-2713(-)
MATVQEPSSWGQLWNYSVALLCCSSEESAAPISSQDEAGLPPSTSWVFDEFKELDTAKTRALGAELWEKAVHAQDGSLNSAFVFVKPHAMTEAVKTLVKTRLLDVGIQIVDEGPLSGKVIDQNKLIDQHYYGIASKATILKPHELNVPVQKFEDHFGRSWQTCIEQNKIFNALDGCSHLGIDGLTLEKAWNEAKDDLRMVKLGGGFYCAKIEIEDKEPIYVLNGFFMGMRAKYTRPDAQIYYFSVQWSPEILSWENFRGKVVGPTDATKAPKESLRGEIFKYWEKLGLKAVPNLADNGIHASASPLEGFAEHFNWCSSAMQTDLFAKSLLSNGVPSYTLRSWLRDAQVVIDGNGSRSSIFDVVEDMDSAACLERLLLIHRLTEDHMYNYAFVYLEPPAVAETTKALVKSRLAESGLEILEEGEARANDGSDAKIYYFSVRWNSSKLPWQDFLTQVIGADDPELAGPSSIRGELLSTWQELGLKEAPTKERNCLHASASPFEGLVERCNMLGKLLGSDDYGRLLLQAGVPEPTFKAWSANPVVRVPKGPGGPIFEQVKAQDAAECLNNLVGLRLANEEKNSALLLIKPHAMTSRFEKLVRHRLEAENIRIVSEGVLPGKTIDEKRLIDQHYYSVASKATLLKPNEMNVPMDKFQAFFDVSWLSALADGKVFNALDACKVYNLDGDSMFMAWNSAKERQKVLELGDDFYCGELVVNSDEKIYVFNGFFMALRAKFTRPQAQVHFLSVEWDAAQLPWNKFQSEVIGSEDPSKALVTSLRGRLSEEWSRLGLQDAPSVLDNGLHASASPFEGFAERRAWLGLGTSADAFGSKMLLEGVPAPLAEVWATNPRVKVDHDQEGTVFEAVKDLNANDCVTKLLALVDLNRESAAPVAATAAQELR